MATAAYSLLHSRILETVLYSFPVTNGIDGREPIGSLVQTSDGNFFGLTFTGGADQAGTLFRLTPDGYESVVHAFGVHSTDGTFPNPSLTLGTDGNFYGTTVAGGMHGLGVVFKITPEVLETIIYNFDDGPPSFGLIQASDGTFYGTNGGGQYGNGSVYSLAPAGLATFLYNFGPAVADGKEPFGNLLQGSDGNFYGVTTMAGRITRAPCTECRRLARSHTYLHSGPQAWAAAAPTPKPGLFRPMTETSMARPSTAERITPEPSSNSRHPARCRLFIRSAQPLEEMAGSQ